MTDGHVATVVRKWIWRDSVHRWTAKCSCGFTSMDRPTLHVANLDITSHLGEVLNAAVEREATDEDTTSAR